MIGFQFRSPRFDDAMQARRADMVRAVALSYAELTRQIQDQGRRELKTAGRFGAWAWRVVGAGRGRIDVYGTTVVEGMEHGLVIAGKPLLWIPLSSAADAQKVPPRRYPGELVKITRPGKAPLLVVSGGEPKYHGQPSVKMPKRLNLLMMIERIMATVGARFLAQLQKL
jgi:hypothetical protein